jgi:mannose/fructose/N-acetylgalactosamine-specific phosphotransferase system component IIC
MNGHIFNASLLIGWAMVLIGACMRDLSTGLVAGGLLLLVIVAAVVRVGGVYLPKTKAEA